MRKNTISSFIEKTWDILQDLEYSSILKWAQDGNSFLILDQQLLCAQVLPKYFKHSNFSSFIRQLNMYNFHKKKTNGSTMEFYHRLFRKDKKELLIGIKRKPSQAQIQFGQELIRKMNIETQKQVSQENIRPGENLTKIGRLFKNSQNIMVPSQTTNDQYCDRQKNMFYAFWMGVGTPLYEINQQNIENIPYKNQERKILTNIIIKNPPSQTIQ